MESMKKMYLKSVSGKKKENDMKKRRFLDNGSVFLKELIADCNGKSVSIRSFSSDQILKATNNFDSSCFVSEDAYYKHRGGEGYKDVVLSARMSNHNNFLKLLGCCLEFHFPVLLSESAEHGVLNQQGGITVNGEESFLPLSLRLKIGKEIANALAYLHMAFPKIIIYRDVKPIHVFLDKNWTAKLSDLLFSISLPEGKSRIEAETVLGTFLAKKKQFWEHSGSDGDPQGILSFVRELCENGKLDEVIDPMMVKDITTSQRLQVEACAEMLQGEGRRQTKDDPSR